MDTAVLANTGLCYSGMVTGRNGQNGGDVHKKVVVARQVDAGCEPIVGPYGVSAGRRGPGHFRAKRTVPGRAGRLEKALPSSVRGGRCARAIRDEPVASGGSFGSTSGTIGIGI